MTALKKSYGEGYVPPRARLRGGFAHVLLKRGIREPAGDRSRIGGGIVMGMSDPHRTRRGAPGAVIAGVVMTYLGSLAMLVSGLMFLIGTGSGTFLGSPTDKVGILNVEMPIGAAPTAGLVMTVAGVALVVLATLVLRRHTGARVALTCLGGLTVSALVYVVVATTNPVPPLVPMTWIVLSVILLWLGRLAR